MKRNCKCYIIHKSIDLMLRSIFVFILILVLLGNYQHRDMIRRGCPNMIQPIENKVPLSLNWSSGKASAYASFFTLELGTGSSQSLLVPDEKSRLTFWNDLYLYTLQLYLYPVAVTDSVAYDWQLSDSIYNELKEHVIRTEQLGNMIFCTVDIVKDVEVSKWAVFVYSRDTENYLYTLPFDFKNRIATKKMIK